MRGKTAKLLRRYARIHSRNYRKLKRVWMAANHLERVELKRFFG